MRWIADREHCSIDGCGAPVTRIKYRMCQSHYNRGYSRGTLSPALTREDLFWQRTIPEPNSGCWLWTAAINADGYGLVKGNKAHRAAWAYANGPIPAGLHVLHRCDLPGCVNPRHLFLGTHRENMADMQCKKRKRRGERAAAAVLTDAQAAEIRHRYCAGQRQGELARAFGVSGNTVRDIVLGKHFAHLGPSVWQPR